MNLLEKSYERETSSYYNMGEGRKLYNFKYVINKSEKNGKTYYHAIFRQDDELWSKHSIRVEVYKTTDRGMSYSVSCQRRTYESTEEFDRAIKAIQKNYPSIKK